MNDRILACCFISVLLISSGFLFRNKKGLSFVQFLWIWILIAFNNGGMDYDGNKNLYIYAGFIQYTDFGLSEWLQIALSRFFQQIGITYEGYTFITTTLCLLLLYRFSLKYSKNISFLLSLFMIYPLVYLVIQKRFFLAMVAMLISLFLLERKKKICSYGVFFLATGLHTSVVMMLPIFFRKKILQLPIIFKIGLFGIECFLLYFFRNNMLLMVADGSSKAENYLQFGMSMAAGIFFMSVMLFSILTNLYLTNNVKEGNNKGAKDKEYRKFTQEINIISFIYLPLLLINSAFFRYYRIIMTYSYFNIEKAYNGAFQENQISFYLALSYPILIGLAMIFLLTMGSFGWDEYLSTLFQYNSAIDFLLS